MTRHDGATTPTSMHTLETPIFPADLMRLLGIEHANTLRRFIKEGKVPPPDKRISQKTRYWHRATLVKAGVIAPDAGNTEKQKS